VQNGNLWDIDGLGAKVIEVVTQQFNQPLVIRHASRSAVRKKRQTQGIDGKMSFNDERFWGRESVPKLSPIGAFVMTEPFGLDTGIAGIFHRKGSR
jgi:hypothetical protein